MSVLVFWAIELRSSTPRQRVNTRISWQAPVQAPSNQQQASPGAPSTQSTRSPQSSRQHVSTTISMSASTLTSRGAPAPHQQSLASHAARTDANTDNEKSSATSTRLNTRPVNKASRQVVSSSCISTSTSAFVNASSNQAARRSSAAHQPTVGADCCCLMGRRWRAVECLMIALVTAW